MSDDTHRQRYTGDHVEAWLTCEGNSCVLDFSLTPVAGQEMPPSQALVEVLFQPRDDRGLPRGVPVMLIRESVPLRVRGVQAISRCWLVDIRPSLARQCHFRILPDAE